MSGVISPLFTTIGGGGFKYFKMFILYLGKMSKLTFIFFKAPTIDENDDFHMRKFPQNLSRDRHSLVNSGVYINEQVG